MASSPYVPPPHTMAELTQQTCAQRARGLLTLSRRVWWDPGGALWTVHIELLGGASPVMGEAHHLCSGTPYDPTGFGWWWNRAWVAGHVSAFLPFKALVDLKAGITTCVVLWTPYGPACWEPSLSPQPHRHSPLGPCFAMGWCSAVIPTPTPFA
jgi:hypothetical protein